MSNSSRHGTAAGLNGRQKMTTQIATQMIAAGLIHLYLRPSVHGPGSNASPIRQRRNTGSTYAMYRPITQIDTTAKNAYGAPLASPASAGAVMIRAHTHEKTTAYAGTR